MGLLDLREPHRPARDRGSRRSARTHLRQACYIGCGSHGVGAVINTRQGRAGRELRRLRSRRHRAQCHSGLKLGRRRADRRRRYQSAKEDWGRRFGMTHYVDPAEVLRRPCRAYGRGDRRRRRLYLRLHRQCRSDADRARNCHRGWGESVIIGVAEGGQGNRDAALSAGDRPGLERLGLRRLARGRTDVPKMVDWYMDGRIAIDPDDHHILPLERHQRGLRSDACGQEHPQRGGLTRR